MLPARPTLSRCLLGWRKSPVMGLLGADPFETRIALLLRGFPRTTTGRLTLRSPCPGTICVRWCPSCQNRGWGSLTRPLRHARNRSDSSSGHIGPGELAHQLTALASHRIGIPPAVPGEGTYGPRSRRPLPVFNRQHCIRAFRPVARPVGYARNPVMPTAILAVRSAPIRVGSVRP